ncbi:MAG: hypothetical protein GY854_20970 [Deltaproteobacteria bacterium]|nr:hypothetical protein [Deltaproteobacteria bacterium]
MKEQNTRRIVIGLVGIFLATTAACQRTEHVKNETTPSPSSATPQESPELLEYVEIVTGGAKETEPLPLIVAVHGLGDRPKHFKQLLEDLPARARVILPRAPISWGMGFAWFRTRIASGDFHALSAGIARAAKQVAVLIGVLKKKRPTRGAPILCGFSQGGMVSFAVAVRHPEAIGLSIPIGGLLPRPLWPKEKKPGVSYPPIRALHGGADDLVQPGPTSAAVKHLRGLDFDVTLTEYPGVPHTVSGSMRRDLFKLIDLFIKK